MNSRNPYFCGVTQTFRLHAHNKKFKILNISLDMLHFLRLTRRQNSQNPYFCSVTQTSGCHLTNLGSTIIHISLYVWQKARSQHRWHQWTLDAEVTHRGLLFCKIGLATKPDRAIDLSCRACGAGAWALGLDSRLGHSRSAPVFTPNLRLHMYVILFLQPHTYRIKLRVESPNNIVSQKHPLEHLQKSICRCVGFA